MTPARGTARRIPFQNQGYDLTTPPPPRRSLVGGLSLLFGIFFSNPALSETPDVTKTEFIFFYFDCLREKTVIAGDLFLTLQRKPSYSKMNTNTSTETEEAATTPRKTPGPCSHSSALTSCPCRCRLSRCFRCTIRHVAHALLEGHEAAQAGGLSEKNPVEQVHYLCGGGSIDAETYVFTVEPVSWDKGWCR